MLLCGLILLWDNNTCKQ